MNKDTYYFDMLLFYLPQNNGRCIKNLDLAYLVLYTDEYFT